MRITITFILQFLLISLALIQPYGNDAHSAEVEKEYQLKAAYLFNFARFISWPEQSFVNEDDSLNICVVGKNPFSSILSKLESKKIKNHPLKILYPEEIDSTSLQQCHLAFYNDSTISQKMLKLRKTLQNTVHISDISGFVDSGGDIEFIVQRSRLRFIINNSGMKDKGLQPRASLLELAADIL